MNDTIKGLIYLIIIVLLGLFLKPLIVMWLWNWVMVSLFGLPHLTYWLSFGLSWLVSLLVGKTAGTKTKSK